MSQPQPPAIVPGPRTADQVAAPPPPPPPPMLPAEMPPQPYYAPQPPPETQYVVGTAARVIPVHPLGSGPQVSAARVAEVTAKAAYVGMERSKLTALTVDIQLAAQQAAYDAIGGVLDGIAAANEAQLATLLNEVQRMPEAAPPQRRGLFAPAVDPSQVVSLVRREDVLNLIAAVMRRRTGS